MALIGDSSTGIFIVSSDGIFFVIVQGTWLFIQGFGRGFFSNLQGVTENILHT